MKNLSMFLARLFRVVSVILVIALTFLSCKDEKEHERQTNSAPLPQVPELIDLKKGKLSSHLRVPGELIGYNEVELYAKVNSFVKEIFVDVGSEVSAGQLLARLEAPEITSQLNVAESKLRAHEALYIASKANHDRLLEASKIPGTVSPNDLDHAIAKMNSDLAQLNAAEAALKEINDQKNYLEIRAPFKGVISLRRADIGAYVGPSGKGSQFPLFVLHDNKRLRLVVSVPESYTAYLSKATDVSFVVKSRPNEVLHGNVTRLARVLDTRLRAERVEIDVQNKDQKLLPGMIADVSIKLQSPDSAFVVPKSAVVNSTEKVFIVRIKHGKVERVPVKTGVTEADEIEIYGTVNQGDKIVKVATEELQDGAVIHL